MTQKTFAICYIIAGICFGISGFAGFAAGRTGYGIVRLFLCAAMIFLAVMNLKMYKKSSQPGDTSAEESQAQEDE